MQHYSYLHRRADTNEVFYIGKGQRKRAWDVNLRSNWWKATVTKAGGFEAKVLAYWSTEVEALEHEKFLIACFRDLDAPLCNMTEGVDGCSGRVVSVETRAKLSAAASKQDLAKLRAAKLGKPLPPEHRAKIGAAGKGRRHSVEAKAKMRAAKFGKTLSAEASAKLHAALRAYWARRRLE
jgi:hypothetical protein